LRAGAVSRHAETPVSLDASSLASDHALAALARALGDPDPAVRAQATTLVATFSKEHAARVLKTMIHDPSPAVRVAAVSATAGKPSMDVVAALIVALADPDADVRRAAAEALSQATGQNVPTMRAGPDDERIDHLKRWWKEQRYAELTRGTEP
jgi:HEAT repeat protein